MQISIKRICGGIGLGALSIAAFAGCGTFSTVADLEIDFENEQLVVYPVNELGDYRWSFDTGSDLTLFDDAAFADVELIETDATALISGTTGRKLERPIEILPELPLEQRGRARPFRLHGLWVVRVPRLRENTGFDAILGYRPFEKRIVEMDLGRERVRLRTRAPRGPGVEYLPLSFDEWRPVIEVPASTGYRFPVIVDTGSNSWFSLTNKDRKHLSIDRAIEKGRLTRGALGETTHALYQFEGSFSLGNAQFRNPLVTGTDQLNESLLGVPALRFVRVTLDPGTQRAAFEVPKLPWTRLGLPPRGITVTTFVTELDGESASREAPAVLPRARRAKGPARHSRWR